MNAGKKPLNVLLFVVDEMRADHMGCAANSIVRTPNLDRLADEGVLFSRAYCNHTVCMPARASMFTGYLPRDHGVWNNNMEMHPGLPILPELLYQAGYHTHGIGKLHLSRWIPDPEIDDPERFPESRASWNTGLINNIPLPYYGFESVDFIGGHGNYVYGDYFRWLECQTPDPRRLLSVEGALEPPTGAPLCYKLGLPAELHYNHWIADKAIDFITEALTTDQPFFLWCSFPDPHEPYSPPRPYCDLYNPADMPLPTRRAEELDDLPPYYKDIFEKRIQAHGEEGGPLPDEYWQEMLALTYGSISFVDAEIGRVLQRLGELGLRENTLVGFISDHGDMLGDHWMIYKGPYVFEGCARIPFILSLPEGIKGQDHAGLVCQLDLLPTILDLCGIETPDEKRLQVEYERLPKLGQVSTLNRWPGKSLAPVLYGDQSFQREAVVIHNDDPYLGLKIRTLVTEQFKITFYAGQEYGEFFDLGSDPQELNNLWDDPAWINKREQLLHKLMHEDTRLAPWYPVPYRTA